MAVLNELRPGLDEKLYERALLLELTQRGHKVSQQRPYPVHYRDVHIGSLVPDLIVDDQVIVEAKVIVGFTPAHVAQMTGYLAITRLSVGLILNFKASRLQWKRLIRTHDSASEDPDPPPSAA